MGSNPIASTLVSAPLGECRRPRRGGGSPGRRAPRLGMPVTSVAPDGWRSVFASRLRLAIFPWSCSLCVTPLKLIPGLDRRGPQIPDTEMQDVAASRGPAPRPSLPRPGAPRLTC